MKRKYDDDEKFNIEEVIDALNSKDAGYLFAGGKRKRTMMRILDTKEFHEWLFNPPSDEKNLAGSIEALYAEFGKLENLERLDKILSDAEEDDFKYARSVATFASSIAAFTLDVTPMAINEAKADMNNGKLTKSAYQDARAQGEHIMELAEDVMSAARGLVEYRAGKLANKTGLPKKFCKSAFTTCPDATFIPKFRIGYWLMNILSELYALAEKEPEKFTKGYFNGTPKYNWEKFFSELFGEENVVECSSYIILEGIKRISTYKSEKVESIWRSLTAFALRNLEEAPSGVREHMLELYLKRLDTMFSNETYELRVNLLELDKKDYPELVETISKYSDKIRSLITREKKRK
jgi:hypothetical protein